MCNRAYPLVQINYKWSLSISAMFHKYIIILFLSAQSQPFTKITSNMHILASNKANDWQRHEMLLLVMPQMFLRYISGPEKRVPNTENIL